MGFHQFHQEIHVISASAKFGEPWESPIRRGLRQVIGRGPPAAPAARALRGTAQLGVRRRAEGQWMFVFTSADVYRCV